jgi:two-component system chemotaxis response regulator CheY
MKILIVDDSRAMRMIVKRTLRQAGFGDHEVGEAEDGKEAVTMLSDASYGLVLTDWNMPNMNGIELAEYIKNNAPQVKVGFVTTEGTPEMRARVMEAGALFLIAKPFTAEDFKSALGRVVQ